MTDRRAVLASIYQFCEFGLFAILCLILVTATAHGFLELSFRVALTIAGSVFFCTYTLSRLRGLNRVSIYLGFLCVVTSYATHQVQSQRSAWLPVELESKELVVAGIVAELPTSKDGNVRFQFILADLYDLHLQPVSGATQYGVAPASIGKRVTLSCYRCTHRFKPGEHWRFIVKLKRPHGYASWGAFDYEKFLFRRGVIATGYLRQADKARRLSEPDWQWTIANKRLQLSQRLRSWSKNSADQSSTAVATEMMLAVSLGIKDGFSMQNRNVFQNTGIAHLMVISGLHIGLIFALSAWLFSRGLSLTPFFIQHYPRQHLTLLPALFLACLYAALAGFSIPTQRALIMLCLFSALRLSGFAVNILQILMVTVLVVILLDPFAVLDVGFWMSFSAVFVIGVWQLGRKLKPTKSDDSNEVDLDIAGQFVQSSTPSVWSRFTDRARQLIELQLSLVCSLIPVSAHFFGKVSLAAVWVNLWAIPLFSLVLIPSVLIVMLAFNLWPDAVLVTQGLRGLHFLLTAIYNVLENLAALEFSAVNMPKASVLTTCVCLSIAVVLILKHKIALMIFLIGGFIGLQSTADPVLKQPIITLLDVGQGLSMVVRYQDKVMVYDVGPRYRSGFNTAEAVLLPYLRDRGVRHVDKLIISHADNDHIGGYEQFISAMSIGHLQTSRVDVLKEATECLRGDQWQWGELRMTVLSPDTSTPMGSNNRSCVLMLEYEAVRVLITGDIEKPVERYLLDQNADLSADIVLVPHQGSKTSSTPEFIKRVDPSLGLVAAGYRNQYGHPHPAVLERYRGLGVELFQSTLSGSIEITLMNDGWVIKEYRKDQPRPWFAVN